MNIIGLVASAQNAQSQWLLEGSVQSPHTECENRVCRYHHRIERRKARTPISKTNEKDLGTLWEARLPYKT